MAKHLFILLVVVFASGCGRPDNARLTVRNIIAVRPGMTMEQVVSILGHPVKRDSVAGYVYFCRCNPERTCRSKWSYTFTYTKRPRMRFAPYPMVWLHFNARKRLKEVYVKEYVLLDDRAIYMTKEDPCDTTDPIVPLQAKDTLQMDRLLKYFDRE
ncbi:MAG TPA: hypothetical protein VHL57_03470 [Flavobacteriales bacterium]|jgi:outer membrane protein assembly factor BamE (lipoprotein component of BamABCDE complex)|nr:hypothetical protein [Flavobacteriales bacterium]